MRWLECHGAETFSDEASGGEAHIHYIRMVVCHILFATLTLRFGAVVEAILIHSVASILGSRDDGGLTAYIRHQFPQYIHITFQQPYLIHRLFDEENDR